MADISSLTGMSGMTGMTKFSGLSGTALDFYNNAIGRVNGSDAGDSVSGTGEYKDSFSHILSSAMDLVGETDSLAKVAEQAEIDFSLGNADSTHEVTIAQQKAYLSLQYTVAVKNALISAYKEIMNIQI